MRNLTNVVALVTGAASGLVGPTTTPTPALRSAALDSHG
jgi:hypothetical protein